MPSLTIQWFPGHMAKTRRQITESLPDVDIVLELLDARIPYSSKNPEIEKILNQKPCLTLLNKCSLADPAMTVAWRNYFASIGIPTIALDCITGEGLTSLLPAIRQTLADKLQRYKDKGMEGKRLRAMVVGIPNVGKSSLINRLCGAKKARVEDRPGVTRSKQWASTDMGLDLLDMPGVLWPKFDEKSVGENLAVTGAIRDQVLDIEEIAYIFVKRAIDCFPDLLCERYKLQRDGIEEKDPYDVFLDIGKKRGFLLRGGETDTQRTATILLDEFRGGKTGRITLEKPAGQGQKNA